jgi:hypothetical protein
LRDRPFNPKFTFSNSAILPQVFADTIFRLPVNPLPFLFNLLFLSIDIRISPRTSHPLSITLSNKRTVGKKVFNSKPETSEWTIQTPPNLYA